MSGRGLGHTGGTLDKMESIPGMTTALTMDDFIAQIKSIGAAVMGQTLKLCPADKLLYSLRDVTATVESIPLIASSIMSKKLASGANVIMLDVKTGNGAFMGDPKDAHALAEAMVRIGQMAGRKTAAIISDMSQPLGNAVGNTLEVTEAIEILQGQYEGDLLTVSMELASRMLCLSGLAASQVEAKKQLSEALRSGRALRKLSEIISAQGGDPRVTEDASRMPKAPVITTVAANRGGVVSAFDCRGLGLAAGALGAGRQKKDDVIDLTVGFLLKKRVGDAVKPGDALFEIHASSAAKAKEAEQSLLDCVTISGSAQKPTLIYGTVEWRCCERYMFPYRR
jgi:pyrimidine-nucleoside phosphorylase